MSRKLKETIIKNLFLSFALASIFVLGLIIIFLFMEGVPIFKVVSVKDFLLGQEWYPTYDPPSFGIWPLIVGSFVVTLFSLLIAVPLGILSAVYIAEIAPPIVKELFKPVIELLAGLPSVVLGFFGMAVLAPWLQETFDLPTGLNIVNASIVLAFMAVPTISSLSEDALYSVPQEFKEASYALGATRFETIFSIIIQLGQLSAWIGLGRACETEYVQYPLEPHKGKL